MKNNTQKISNNMIKENQRALSYFLINFAIENNGNIVKNVTEQ